MLYGAIWCYLMLFDAIWCYMMLYGAIDATTKYNT